MKAGINNLMLGNSKNSLVKIVANKNQTLEDMEARQRPSKELYLTVQKQPKFGSFADKMDMSEFSQIKAIDEVDLMTTGGIKPVRELTNIEEKVLENAVKEGNLEEVKLIFSELQKELPPPPQKLENNLVTMEKEDKATEEAIERLEKEKEFQKKLILYGGIGTCILLLVTIVVGIILIRSN